MGGKEDETANLRDTENTMKTTPKDILTTVALLIGLCVGHAADKKHLGGPKGGRLLEKTVGARFNYEEMAKRTLGAHWAKLSDAERREFVDLFTSLLTSTYADKITGYSGEQVQYLNERLEGDYAEVRTKVESGKAEVPLDYRLLNQSGDWRVYDVIVDGVSLVNNYRGQFTKILRTSSFADLLEQLRKKSDKIKSP